MQTTHHTIRAHALIVLVELHLVAYQWLYFLFKLSLAKVFKEIATSISKQARLNDEHAFNISLYYFHFINFNRFVQKRATKLHHRKVAQKMGEGAVRPYICYFIPCIFFHKANQVLNNGSLNASVG